MSKTSISALFAFITLGAAFVIGLELVGADGSAPMVTTILGLLGLTVTQILGNKATEEVRDDLRNGRVEQLLKNALQRAAEDKNVPLTIDTERKEDENNG